MKKVYLLLSGLAAIFASNVSAQDCDGADAGHVACFTSIAPTSQTTNMIIPTETHTFQMLIKEGDAYSEGGGQVGGLNDFTGYVPIDSSSVDGYLSINHETTPGGVSMLEISFDSLSNLWSVDRSRAVDFSVVSIRETERNCSGGVTPWGTILTAEESTTGGDFNLDGYDDIGWLVEIDPATASIMDYGSGPEKVWGAGRLNHENAVVLNDSITLYTGEDGGSSAVFKFIADNPADLSSGTLFVLKLNEPMASNEPQTTKGVWVEMPQSTPAELSDARSNAQSLGATNFNGVEDVEFHPITGQIYFTAKGASRVYRFTDEGDSVQNFETFVGGMDYEIITATDTFQEPWGGGNDNLTFDDFGNLWVLQDGGRNYIWVVGNDHTQASPDVRLFSSMPAGSEPTGLTFSPDYRFGFFSVQHPSSTNTTQRDAAGDDVVFDVSSTVVMARVGELGERLELPIVEFEADTTVITVGDTLQFTDLTLNDPTAWFWSFQGATVETSNDQNPRVVYDSAGSYDVSLGTENVDGLSTILTKSEYIEVQEETINIQERDAILKDFTIYPNPVQDIVNVSFKANAGQNVRIELMQSNGQVVDVLYNATGNGNVQNVRLDVAQYVVEGTIAQYLMVINIDGQTAGRPIQIQK